MKHEGLDEEKLQEAKKYRRFLSADFSLIIPVQEVNLDPNQLNGQISKFT